MKEWKAAKWGMWLVIAALSGVLGMWMFRHYAGVAQLIGIGISSGVMAVVARIRSETIRWQDSHMRRIDNTSKIIAFYNTEIRKLVIEFMRQFRLEKSKALAGLASASKNGQIDPDFEVGIAVKLDLATILHLLDHLAWLLKQTNYLYREEILYAVASELKRLLLAEEYAYVIEQLRRGSSLRNLDYLMTKIEEVESR